MSERKISDIKKLLEIGITSTEEGRKLTHKRKTDSKKGKEKTSISVSRDDIVDMLTYSIAQINSIEQEFIDNKDKYNYLYPNILDPNFNIKIAEKKEFYDNRYDTSIKDVKEESKNLCGSDFELSPHQIFVRNFLSMLTPYNSLLLFHGLGTGKTCSAISVCEEMRDYMKQIGVSKRIIIIAAPNVQENFKKQLFDERRLHLDNGRWNLTACTGNKFLKEINPTNLVGLTKKKVISLIKSIIRRNYIFVGYIEFSNILDKIREKYKKNYVKELRKQFSNSLIVIDEVHNIRITGDNPKKKIAKNLMGLVKHVKHIKLLLMSATPMFNNFKEIVFLLNLMNVNDDNSKFKQSDVFDKQGNFKTDSHGNMIGKDLLIRKARGYISYVSGENPYSFPFRIFPNEFDKKNTIKAVGYKYPSVQMDNIPIIQKIEHMDIYLNKLHEYQKKGYDFIMNSMIRVIEPTGSKGSKGSKRGDDLSALSSIETSGVLTQLPNMEGFEKEKAWHLLDKPLQALNMIYPSKQLDKYIKDTKQTLSIMPRDIIGTQGLKRLLSFEEQKANYKYKPTTLTDFGRIFSQDKLINYSAKLKTLTSKILQSKGIILVYSQYIDGGCIPIALALEEIGITRYGSHHNLFEKEPVSKIDALTMKPRKKDKPFKSAKYIMITGNHFLSPHNNVEITAATNDSNLYGKDVKVIIISQAGSEGIDLKNIRQVHIMEPWYNNNRIEQIIGRAVRYCSHYQLPFEERNVEIYFHGTSIEDTDIEPIDMYVYRLAENKSVQIGQVTRILKETAVDCILNKGINDMGVDKVNQTVDIEVSSGQKIKYAVGNKPYSTICDYKESCSYKCIPCGDTMTFGENDDSFNERFIVLNIDKIVQNIKELYKHQYVFTKKNLLFAIEHKYKKYPLIQIDSALQQLITEPNEYLVDMFGRSGKLINIDMFYLFQPIELVHSNLSNFERKYPLEYKRQKLIFNLPTDAIPTTIFDDETKTAIFDSIKTTYDHVFSKDTPMIDVEKKRQGNKNWYDECNIIINKNILNLFDIDDEDKVKLCVLHRIIDMLPIEKKIGLIEYIYSKTDSDLTDFEQNIKNYIDNMNYVDHSIKHNLFLLVDSALNIPCYKITDDDKIKEKAQNKVKSPFKFFTLKNKKLTTTTITTQKYILEHNVIPKKYKLVGGFNDLIGFITNFKDTKKMVYKTMNITVDRDKGVRCDQSTKRTAIDNLKQIYDDYNADKVDKLKLNKNQVCCIQEILLRYYQLTNKDGKTWFLTPEEYMIHICRPEDISNLKEKYV